MNTQRLKDREYQYDQTLLKVFGDGKDKKIQDRAKTEFIYVLDEHELSDNQNAIGVHCPNCNSPITDIEHKTCSYCGTQVVLVLGRVFACNDIKRY